MQRKKVKLQITVTEDLHKLIENEVEELFTTKSKLLTKIIDDYFKGKTKDGSLVKKIIELNIKK
jgi:hypothetical protein